MRQTGADAERASAWVRPRLEGCQPDLGIVLGSGLGAAAEALEDPVALPFAEIPGFPATSVRGHEGRLVFGTLDGVPLLLQAGRYHLYEGHTPAVAALPVRVMHALGVRTLILSNAAGGIRPGLRAGDLMLIADQINLMWRNPLTGPVRPGEERFPDMSAPYDAGLRRILRAAAVQDGIALEEGVYAGLLGPSYETPAEVRVLRRIGADAVGMSTVPEVIAARALGMRVAGVSCIANAAAGVAATPLSHAEVLKSVGRASEAFVRIVRRAVGRMR